MENETFRSIHSCNASISTAPPLASPRKQRGVMRTISTGESSDDCSAKEKERSRFFRLLSPKKAMARKAQAKKQQRSSETMPNLTPESMDAIGILPFESKIDGARGRAATRRGNITISNDVLSEIGQAVEDESSFGVDDVFPVEETKSAHQEIALPGLPAVLSPSKTPPPQPDDLYAAKDKGLRKSPRRKGPAKPDFQASMDIGELFNAEQENPPGADNHYSRQEDELLAMALEKSKKDFGRVSSVSPIRKKRNPLQVVDETQCWSIREQRKTRAMIVQEQRVEPNRKTGGASTSSEEELRLLEEEQEREMIELALERSLAEAAQQGKRHRQPVDSHCGNFSSPHRVPYHQSEVASGPSQDDEDEFVRKEEEMIRRAMEMSMRDF